MKRPVEIFHCVFYMCFPCAHWFLSLVRMRGIYVTKWRTDIQFSCIPEISCAQDSKTLRLQTEFVWLPASV
jgi:hypothetical protein